ncbi:MULTISPECIES: hypothetical protein [Agrobacterium]|uniref:Uncharacterized protein n=1 Tax=Agrobacterium rosae TaxID=1972867 RepID=A0AAW9F6M6_9HYPH|nr:MULTISPECIES: hypothetical protein [Agrobacterium]MBN7804348.1 hypothetical protein [Agrobacterium rosae]MDX8302222.1 hypothetical protein [Agrobacterium rosae]POO55513.1 hypothetical protein CTT39_11175 [Agrobacterium rosae]
MTTNHSHDVVILSDKCVMLGHQNISLAVIKDRSGRTPKPKSVADMFAILASESKPTPVKNDDVSSAELDHVRRST